MDALFIFMIVVYFLPAMVGWNTKGKEGIIVLNLFLGWTFIGWVIALIWATQSPKYIKQ